MRRILTYCAWRVELSYPLTFQGSITSITGCSLKGGSSSPQQGLTSKQLCQSIYGANWYDGKCNFNRTYTHQNQCPETLFGNNGDPLRDNIMGGRSNHGVYIESRYIEYSEVAKGFWEEFIISCCGTKFHYNANQVCSGEVVNSRNNCGSSREVTGTGDCTAGTLNSLSCSTSICPDYYDEAIVPNYTTVPSCFCMRKRQGIIKWVEVGKSGCSKACPPDKRLNHSSCSCVRKRDFSGTRVTIRFKGNSSKEPISPTMRFSNCGISSCLHGRKIDTETCTCRF